MCRPTNEHRVALTRSKQSGVGARDRLMGDVYIDRSAPPARRPHDSRTHRNRCGQVVSAVLALCCCPRHLIALLCVALPTDQCTTTLRELER